MPAQKTITGKVIDETGETIIGANVVVKGTTNGTITDFDGNFTMKLRQLKSVQAKALSLQCRVIIR